MRQPERRKGVIESEGGCRPERGLECRPRLGAIPAGGLFAARQSLSANVKEVNDVESKRKFFQVSVFCLTLLSTILCFSTAFGAIINVPGAYESIQGAINAAADGTYTGEGNNNLDLQGKAISVKSRSGAEACIIDCEGGARGFYFHSNEGHNSVVSGFSIINGQAYEGGGIYICNSSPTRKNCKIEGCETIAGEGNSGGGGIYVGENSSPLITKCTIQGNSGQSGGGIFCEGGSPVVRACVIRNNDADVGGGVCIESNGISSAILTNCLITGNFASAQGGGIKIGGDGTPAIIGCTISDNEVTSEIGQGGGIYLDELSVASILSCIDRLSFVFCGQGKLTSEDTVLKCVNKS